MSSIVLSPGATGAAAFTIEAPSTATSRVITLPDATDTLVGKATTDTLTNKTVTAPVLSGSVTGTYTLAGTPTITSPTITGATMSTMASSVLTSVAALAATSGTSLDFTNIPSWVKRITINFQGVSTNGTAFLFVRLGTGSTTYVTSGYLGATNSANSITNQTAGFGVIGQPATANIVHGAATLTNISGNNWCFASTAYVSQTAVGGGGAGSLALGAVLTAVRITTDNGSDVFDAGSVNIIYE